MTITKHEIKSNIPNLNVHEIQKASDIDLSGGFTWLVTVTNNWVLEKISKTISSRLSPLRYLNSNAKNTIIDFQTQNQYTTKDLYLEFLGKKLRLY